jgi:hypothetical protein
MRTSKTLEFCVTMLVSECIGQLLSDSTIKQERHQSSSGAAREAVRNDAQFVQLAIDRKP